MNNSMKFYRKQLFQYFLYQSTDASLNSNLYPLWLLLSEFGDKSEYIIDQITSSKNSGTNICCITVENGLVTIVDQYDESRTFILTQENLFQILRSWNELSNAKAESIELWFDGHKVCVQAAETESAKL